MEEEAVLLKPTEQILRKVELEEDLKESILIFLLLYGYKRINKTDELGCTFLWLKNDDEDLEVRILRYKNDRGNWEYQIDFLYDGIRKTVDTLTKQAEICACIIDNQGITERDRKLLSQRSL